MGSRRIFSESEKGSSIVRKLFGHELRICSRSCQRMNNIV